MLVCLPNLCAFQGCRVCFVIFVGLIFFCQVCFFVRLPCLFGHISNVLICANIWVRRLSAFSLPSTKTKPKAKLQTIIIIIIIIITACIIRNKMQKQQLLGARTRKKKTKRREKETMSKNGSARYRMPGSSHQNTNALSKLQAELVCSDNRAMCFATAVLAIF